MNTRGLQACRLILALLTVVTATDQSAGLDLLRSRKYAYVLRISPAASYQLQPGDYIQIDVSCGPAAHRSSFTAAKRVQVIRIADQPQGVYLSVAMSQHEIRSIQQAFTRDNPYVALRIVQKQPRSGIEAPPGDGIEDLNFDEDTHVAQKLP